MRFVFIVCFNATRTNTDAFISLKSLTEIAKSIEINIIMHIKILQHLITKTVFFQGNFYSRSRLLVNDNFNYWYISATVYFITVVSCIGVGI